LGKRGLSSVPVHGGGPPSWDRRCQRVSRCFIPSKRVFTSVTMWSSCWQPEARRALLCCAHRRRLPPEHRRAALHSNPKFTATVDPYPNSPRAYLHHFLAHLQNPPFFSLSHQSTGIHHSPFRRRQSATVVKLVVVSPSGQLSVLSFSRLCFAMTL